MREQRCEHPAERAAVYWRSDVRGRHVDPDRAHLNHPQQLDADRHRDHVQRFYDNPRVERFDDRLDQQFDEHAACVDVDRQCGLLERQLDGDSDDVDNHRGHGLV